MLLSKTVEAQRPKQPEKQNFFGNPLDGTPCLKSNSTKSIILLFQLFESRGETPMAPNPLREGALLKDRE
jgi:hypothetical protein